MATSTPTVFDHVFVVLVAVLLPIVSAWRFPKLRARILAGDRRARSRAYVSGAVLATILTMACLLLFYAQGRPVQELGLRAYWGGSFWFGLALVLLYVVAQLRGRRRVLQVQEQREQALQQLRAWDALVPRSRGELQLFCVLTVIGAAFEELFFRGFLTWYLSPVMPLFLAYFMTSIVFGLNHAYQGRKGVLVTAFLGVQFSFLYMFSYSLWIPIAVHGFHNIASALLGRRLLLMQESEPAQVQATTSG